MRLQRPPHPGPTTGKRKTSSSKVFYSQPSSSGSTVGSIATHGNLSSASALSNLSRRTYATSLMHAACSGAPLVPPTTEISSYLDSDTITQFEDDFNVLAWWHEHKLTYPVVFILARDIMTLLISAISSESAFSTTSRVLEEWRRRLTPCMVEMLTLVKDWELADARL
jgi:hypothetical protein